MHESFKKQLKAAVDLDHPDLAFAMILDGKQDDYVRQYAIGALLNYHELTTDVAGETPPRASDGTTYLEIAVPHADFYPQTSTP